MLPFMAGVPKNGTKLIVFRPLTKLAVWQEKCAEKENVLSPRLVAQTPSHMSDIWLLFRERPSDIFQVEGKIYKESSIPSLLHRHCHNPDANVLKQSEDHVIFIGTKIHGSPIYHLVRQKIREPQKFGQPHSVDNIDLEKLIPLVSKHSGYKSYSDCERFIWFIMALYTLDREGASAIVASLIDIGCIRKLNESCYVVVDPNRDYGKISVEEIVSPRLNKMINKSGDYEFTIYDTKGVIKEFSSFNDITAQARTGNKVLFVAGYTNQCYIGDEERMRLIKKIKKNGWPHIKNENNSRFYLPLHDLYIEVW